MGIRETLGRYMRGDGPDQVHVGDPRPGVQAGQEQRSEPHDLVHVVTDRQIAVAALLAVDELRVDAAADDGTGSDLEIIHAIDVRRKIAADTCRRQ